jgi:hypothetical protein
MAVMIHHQSLFLSPIKGYEEIAKDILDANESIKASNKSVEPTSEASPQS